MYVVALLAHGDAQARMEWRLEEIQEALRPWAAAARGKHRWDDNLEEAPLAAKALTKGQLRVEWWLRNRAGTAVLSLRLVEQMHRVMFDVFAVRDRVVGEYHDYFESFVNILDPRIDQFVRGCI